MTVIEFLDKDNRINNIAAVLCSKPDRVIYMGDNKAWARQKEAITSLCTERGLPTEIQFKSIGERGDRAVSMAVDFLEGVLEENQDTLIFDVTGGGNAVTLAAGIVYGRHAERGIQLHRYDLKSGRVFDYDQDGFVPQGDKPRLTVEELAQLSGGTIVTEEQKKDGTIQWDLQRENFLSDLVAMWDICRRNPGRWNVQTTALGVMQKLAGGPGDGLSLTVSSEAFEVAMREERLHISLDAVYPELQAAGLLTLDTRKGNMAVTFKSKQVMNCLTKAGSVLELMTFWAVQKTGRFGDVMTGVYLDWDGALREGPDVENEVDVLAMEGMQPVFISCKNGAVNADELYKLHTVATRFGGSEARKYLMLTGIRRMAEENRRALMDRAQAMQIVVLSDLGQETAEGFLARVAAGI